MTQWTALSLTLLIEIPVVLLYIRLAARHLPDDAQTVPWKVAAVAAAASCLTHPIVWNMVTHVLSSWSFVASTALMETFAVLAEAVVYWIFLRVGPKHAFAVSLLANGISFGIGLLLP